MKKFAVALTVLAGVALVCSNAWAQLPNSPEVYSKMDQGAGKNSAGATLGASKWGEDLYLDLNLMLELSFDKIALGLNVPIHVLVWDRDPENTDEWYYKYLFRKEDWDEVRDYFRIIRYVKYGCKYCEENYVYGLFGDLMGVSLGHGTIVGLYFNNLEPTHYRPGLQLDVYWPEKLGVETLLNDITRPNVLGGRVYVHPTGFFLEEGSYLNNLAVGFTVVTDYCAPETLVTKQKTDANGNPVTDANGNPVLTVDTEDGFPKVKDDSALTVIGFDTEFRVLNLEWFKLTPFWDLNHIVHHGVGTHLGVLADFLFGKPLTLNTRLEYRYFGDEYLPTYFDAFYEIDRYMFAGSALPKQKAIESAESKHGYYAGASLFFFGLFRLGSILEDYQGEYNTTFIAFADTPKLGFIKLSAWYMKSNFEDWDEVTEFDERSLLTVQAKLYYSVMVMIIKFQRTWRFDEDEGKYEPMDDWSFGAGVEFTF